MKTDPSRATLLSLALVPMMALALPSPASAADETEKTEKVEETTGIVPATVTTVGKGMPTPYGMPRKGGTAVINFIAPVTPKTMADLVKNAQNAVISGAEGIRINISSPGGSVTAMQFAVNVLKTLSVPIETAAMSSIGSAAVALFCMGEKRYMGEGTSIFLHQQTNYQEVQDKTIGALVRRFEVDNAWYDALLYDCIDEDTDRAMLDDTTYDLIIDAEQAKEMGMATHAIEDLRDTEVWGMVINVTGPDVTGRAAYPYPFQ